MGILAFLFGENTKIDFEIDIPILGRVVWEEDEESWKGTSNGIEYFLSYETGQPSPTQEVIDYALLILEDMASLERALEKEKEKYKLQYKYHHEEVDALSYSSLHFYRFKSNNQIIAQLDPGQDFRAWRIEFVESDCHGIGFDS